MQNQKPAAVFARPKEAFDTEEAREWQEEQQDLARKRARESAKGNKVTAFLGQRFWRHDKTWPSLYWKVAGVQESVEMYFPALNLGVDRYPRPTSRDRQAAAFKAMALKALGVKYCALFPEHSIKVLEAYR